VTEAPPPCEACGMYPGVRPMDRYPSHHALLAAKDAEIAELRALFGPLMDEADWHVEGCDCAGCVWFARARAALAPKEGRE
jgi:hypothetical protein